ncbi:MAG: peptidase domain-containing ABC transporter, partial [Sediminibacterium sp.]
RHINLQVLRDYCDIGKTGVSLLGLSLGAEKIGFKTRGVKVSLSQLLKEAPCPCILHWDKKHFVVLPPQNIRKNNIIVADPASGLQKLTLQEFKQSWVQDNEDNGVVLLLEPTTVFYQTNSDDVSGFSWIKLLRYLSNYKKFILQLIFGLLIGSFIQLLIPFLTQGLVDYGINKNNLEFINIILLAQLMLFVGRIMIDLIRSRILLFISTHVNLSILSEFWIKLMKLPLNFYELRQTGDILQRINDHQRIQSFLTGSALNTFFSLFNLLIFSFILLSFNTSIFYIFLSSSILYLFWIKIFLSYRKKLDHKKFVAQADENSTTIQLIQGMRDIKLNSAERQMRWGWENVQSKVFNLSFKSLSLNQTQQIGAFIINEGKNIIITFVVAKAVLEGQLTLGAMLAIQYIIGQLNSPIEQLINFIQQAQDAKLSMERLNEIHGIDDEEPHGRDYVKNVQINSSIFIKNLSFSYPGSGNELALNNINLEIPEGKVTALVGMSGCGKTTLMKLLLRFYENYSGEIKIGSVNIKNISPNFWRKNCGSVLQDGFIFNDTILKNIAVGDEDYDLDRVIEACELANIKSFIQELPMNFSTILGNSGIGISQGQKQRILIARAIYRNPKILFFDEATNALDANNEMKILDNLNTFFQGRTVVVAAHRLSTIKNADSIIVFKKGVVVEYGSHNELINQYGHYYELVKNQLEMEI